MKDYRIFLITIATAILSMTMFFISLYFGWFGPFMEVGRKFCETMHLGLIKQPANTWSNLGFVFAGLAMAWHLTSEQHHYNENMFRQESSFCGTFFSCLTVLLGPGSMALHASGTSLGAFLDMCSMYLIASFMASYATVRLFALRSMYFLLIFSFSFGIFMWVDRQSDIHFIFYHFGDTVFAFYILIIIIFEIINIKVRKLRHTNIWGFASFAALALAFFIWNRSLTGGPWCDPESIIQGHAIWHLLDAFALYCLFRYYVSEKTEPRLEINQYNL
jgi:hypothetical protein